MNNFPKIIPVFPLSNFIIFPKTSVPLNIFESRYIDMVNDAMKSDKLIGMIQPIYSKNEDNLYPKLHDVGCMGKITSFKETENNSFLIELKGITRFKIIKEIKNNKKYRECEINFDDFKNDLVLKKEILEFSDIEIIFKNLKNLFEKKGYLINWKLLEKQNLDETINVLAMASPFSLEEKQVLLETQNLTIRKNKIEEILNTYILDNFNNTTIQ